MNVKSLRFLGSNTRLSVFASAPVEVSEASQKSSFKRENEAGGEAKDEDTIGSKRTVPPPRQLFGSLISEDVGV